MEEPSRQPVCFDADLAVFPTRIVDVSRLVDPVHVSHGDGEVKIGEYRRAMARGECFPPVSVIRWRDRFLVADGHKRLAACRELGVERLVVEVWTLRRWIADQWGQLSRKSRQQARLVARSPFDAGARRDLRRLALDTVGHWKRIAASTWRRVRGGKG